MMYLNAIIIIIYDKNYVVKNDNRNNTYSNTFASLQMVKIAPTEGDGQIVAVDDLVGVQFKNQMILNNIDNVYIMFCVSGNLLFDFLIYQRDILLIVLI